MLSDGGENSAAKTLLDGLEAFEQEHRAPHPGDILLFHNAKGSNNLIGWFTGSPFYHAAIYAGNGMAVEARTPGVLHDTLEDRSGNYIVIPRRREKERPRCNGPCSRSEMDMTNGMSA